MYSAYVPKVNARNAIPSDFTIDVEFTETDGSYDATITVENVGGNTATGLVLHVTITESKLPISWGLSDQVNFVNRLMVPDQNGTPLDFSGSSTQVVNLSFTTASHWDVDNCEIVAFVQRNQTKEIFQGTKKFMAIPLYNIDAEAKAVKYPTGEFCGSTIEPIILVKNMGAENLTSLDIEYSINGGTAQLYAWTGDLGFNLGEEVTLPEITFVPEASNTFDVSVSNPNGVPDPNPDNNILAQDFMAAPVVETTVVNFEIKTDQYPSETTWDVKNSAGTTLYQGGPYSSANTVFYDEWELNDLDCYTFTIYDEYGDGICCAFGNGYFKLFDGNNVLFSEGGQFGSEDVKPFERFGENILTADFMANVTSIIEGESVNFTDLSIGGVTDWMWEFEGGDPATSSDQNPMVTYALEGMYDVTLTVSDGSGTNTIIKEEYIAVDHITGIPSNVNQLVQIFPNPTTGKVYISGVENANVNVFNTSGKLVASFSNFNDNMLDISDLDSGIYFIKVVVENETVVNKKVSLLK